MSDIVAPNKLEKQVTVFKALSSEARLAIVYALRSGEKNVNQLVDMLGELKCACSVERTNISKHLSVLKEAEIVSCRDEGLKRIYSINLICLSSILDCLETSSDSKSSETESKFATCGRG